MSIVGQLSPVPRQMAFSGGVFAPGAKLYQYQAGTSSNLPTYSDGALTIANANPLVASASGLFGPIFMLFAQSYRFLLTTSAGVTIWDQDNVLGYPFATGKVTTAQGVQNNLEIDIGVSLLVCNNASDLTIGGIAMTGAANSPLDGQFLAIVSKGGGNVLLVPESGGSTTFYRFTNMVTSGNTYLAAGKGVAIYQYDLSSLRWRLVAHDQGNWIAQNFSAGDFTAATGNWTVSLGDVVDNKFYLRGRQLFVTTTLQTTTISATPASLSQAIPGGYSANGAVNAVWGLAVANPSGTYAAVQMSVAGSAISYFPTIAGTGTWGTTTDTTALKATHSFLVT